MKKDMLHDRAHSAIERALALTLENRRAREEAWHLVERSRLLARELAETRSNPPPGTGRPLHQN
ncbi:MAG: hypothetical protein EOR72_00225 [Mesorhizobium sp.]|uniref:hypothetical protein n=1 Tax=Mesorhizobium sp. TaxID=1871066 RepID=UPI000FE8D1E1|nr:hypothetical protein [Mesorhizobium sp.]RWM19664.1 MAG: hypothetical protein EOR72_00225 [Mesorhizobium sp.]